MDTRFWGPPGWKLLHQIAYQYPENPTPEDKLNYGIFYSNLANVLPCKYCRNSFTKYIKNLPIDGYLETKTKKTGENLRILQTQADSVRAILDASLGTLASEQDRVPNANPLLSTATVEGRRKQVDVQTSAAVFEEIVKNLEMAKISHRINTPLIQLIDSPRLPLKRTEIRLVKGSVYGAFILGVLALSLLYLRRLYQKHLQEV